MIRSRPGQATIMAFIAMVVLGGANGVAIRVSNQELAPFWGATVRFGLASAVLFAIVALGRIPLPRGRALTGSLIYGVLTFGTAFALVYWALVDAPAGLGQVILALVPLLTLILAVSQGLERFHWQGVAGALLALLGIAVVFGDRIGTAVPVVSMLAILAAAVCLAEGSVAVKRFPRSHPVANNAVAMGIGALVLIVVSLIAGEPRVLPSSPQTWLAIGHLVVIGSVVVFVLFLYVIERWTASATSYVLLLMPLVAVPFSALVLDERITLAFLFGGILVLAGVYVGAFAPSLSRPLPGLFAARARPAAAGAVAGAAESAGSEEPGPPSLATPTCP